MASYVKFLDFTEKLIRGQHDWDNHEYKLALTADTPNNGQESFTPGSLHRPPQTAAFGYPSGGATLTPSPLTVAESGGTTTISANQVVFTALAGGIGPFRYAILYNATNSNLVAYWDYGSTPITLQEGETFTVKFNNTTPGIILSLT